MRAQLCRETSLPGKPARAHEKRSLHGQKGVWTIRDIRPEESTGFWSLQELPPRSESVAVPGERLCKEGGMTPPSALLLFG